MRISGQPRRRVNCSTRKPLIAARACSTSGKKSASRKPLAARSSTRSLRAACEPQGSTTTRWPAVVRRISKPQYRSTSSILFNHRTSVAAPSERPGLLAEPQPTCSGWEPPQLAKALLDPLPHFLLGDCCIRPDELGCWTAATFPGRERLRGNIRPERAVSEHGDNGPGRRMTQQLMDRSRQCFQFQRCPPSVGQSRAYLPFSHRSTKDAELTSQTNGVSCTCQLELEVGTSGVCCRCCATRRSLAKLGFGRRR
jgi:hypothetical protein